SLRQFFDRTVPRNLTQVSAQNLIGLMKQIRRGRKLLCEIPSHPDALRALTCKKQCDFFRHTRLANRVQSRARAKLLGARVAFWRGCLAVAKFKTSPCPVPLRMPQKLRLRANFHSPA